MYNVSNLQNPLSLKITTVGLDQLFLKRNCFGISTSSH